MSARDISENLGTSDAAPAFGRELAPTWPLA
jgi:hypothetical protein